METIFNEIVRDIHGKIKESEGEDSSSSTILEFGTITSTGLKLDNFKHEIKDYMILEHLGLKEEYITEISGTYTHNHTIKTPDELKPLNAGDRVLVSSIGSEFVVIGRIRNG